MKWEFIDPIEWKGTPTQTEMDLALQQSQALAKMVKEYSAK